MRLILIFLLTMNLNLNLQINEKYIPLLSDNTRTQIVFGGSSSGKSFFLIGQRMILDLLAGGRNYLATRNVANTLRDSIYNEAVKSIENNRLNKLFKINKTDMTITCVNGYQAILKGLDNVEKVKSITPRKGVITDLLMEEATEDSYEDVKQLIRRLRGKADKPKRITFIFNPIDKTHWIYNEYFLGRFGDNDTEYRDEKLLILKATYKDNLRFLEQEDIDELENETNEYYYNVYTLGNWGVLGNVIFKNWRTEDLTDVFNEFDDYYNGLDFGYTNDPTALVRSAVHRKTIYVRNPIYERGMTNDIIALRARPIIHKERVLCDAAEPKSIQELRNHGINAAKAIKGPGSLSFGIQYLQQYNLVVHKEDQNIINELMLYQWDKNKDGRLLQVPVDKDNHAIDALRYAHSYRMRQKKELRTPRQAGVYLP